MIIIIMIILPQSKTERRQGDKYQDHARELKKAIKHESDGDTNCNLYTQCSIKGLVRGLKDLEIRGRVDNIQTTACVRLARILKRVLEI